MRSVSTRFPPVKDPPAAWRRIAPRSTAASLNVASPTSNVCASPTTWRFPFVQITAAVGTAGVTTPGSPAAGLGGVEPAGSMVGDEGCALAGADGGADACVGADGCPDLGALSRMTGTNGSRGFIRSMALTRFAGADVAALAVGWRPVVAGAPVAGVAAAPAAGVAAGGAAVLGADSEPFRSFGSWMA